MDNVSDLLRDLPETDVPATPPNDTTTPPRRRRARIDAPPTAEPQPIHLLPHQVEHAARLESCLRRFGFAMDLSPMGAGKTYCASSLWQSLGLRHVVVIAPVSVLPKWNSMRDTHGIAVAHAISYCSLRSIRGKQPKHGLLTRTDEIRTQVNEDTNQLEENMHIVNFHATSLWNRLVDEGVLLVIDELQHVKNQSSQSKSVKELLRVVRASANSKALLLSGTPIDKCEQALNLYKVIGILDGPLAVYNPHTGLTDPRGYRRLVEYHIGTFYNEPSRERLDGLIAYMNEQRRYREIRTEHADMNAILHCMRDILRSSHYYMSATTRRLEGIYMLFRDVFCRYASSSMPHMSTVIAATLHKHNAYYEIQDTSSRELLQKGVQALCNATGYDFETDTVNIRDHMDAVRGIVRAQQMIETAKIPTLIRVAREALEANPNQKVVISVNFTDTITDLVAALSSFGPVVIHGATSERQRHDVMTRFQAATAEVRLLIANTTCISTGIDLDDKDSRFPRLALVSPNYNIITLHQLCFRFHRIGTLSDAHVHFVFGRVTTASGRRANGFEELPILNALARKSTVLRDISQASMGTESASAGAVSYPGEFPTWNEVVV